MLIEFKEGERVYHYAHGRLFKLLAIAEGPEFVELGNAYMNQHAGAACLEEANGRCFIADKADKGLALTLADLATLGLVTDYWQKG